jgi:hypothetical protein
LDKPPGGKILKPIRFIIYTGCKETCRSPALVNGAASEPGTKIGFTEKPKMHHIGDT